MSQNIEDKADAAEAITKFYKLQKEEQKLPSGRNLLLNPQSFVRLTTRGLASKSEITQMT